MTLKDILAAREAFVTGTAAVVPCPPVRSCAFGLGRSWSLAGGVCVFLLDSVFVSVFVFCGCVGLFVCCCGLGVCWIVCCGLSLGLNLGAEILIKYCSWWPW